MLLYCIRSQGQQRTSTRTLSSYHLYHLTNQCSYAWCVFFFFLILWRHCIEWHNGQHQLHSTTGLLWVNLLWQRLQHWPTDLTYILAGIWNSGSRRICIRCSASHAYSTKAWSRGLPHLYQANHLNDPAHDHTHPLSTSESHILCCKYAQLHLKACKSKQGTHTYTGMWTQAYVQRQGERKAK